MGTGLGFGGFFVDEEVCHDDVVGGREAEDAAEGGLRWGEEVGYAD